jgi:hypothetical protein
MSTVVFGVLILFVVASMVHFLHEWWDARRHGDPDESDETGAHHHG